MNINKILIIIFTLILVSSVVGFGNESIEKIEAYLVSDLNFKVDGEEWSPKDVDGSPLIPLNYKGRTYVPVRSLLEDKEVTVGYEADTRTVLLDYSTMKHLDKSSPYIAKATVDNDPMGAGMWGRIVYTIEENPNFEMDSIGVKQEITLKISEDGKVYAWDNNTRTEMSLEEFASSGESIAIEKASFNIDEETGMVTSMELFESEEKARLADDFHITIRITQDPFKIHIIIEW